MIFFTDLATDIRQRILRIVFTEILSFLYDFLLFLHWPSTTQRSTTWQIFISSVTMILHQMKNFHLWRQVLLLPFLWMTLQTSQWSQILQIKFCRKQSAYVVLSNDKYAGNFHNANCLHIIHKGALSKLNCKRPFFFLFTDCQSQHHSSWFAHIWLPLY